MEFKTIYDVGKALVDGFDDWKSHGEVFVKHEGDLSLFCYLPSASYKDEWTYLESVSRGLIMNNQTGEVVARPFDKFFNWMQDGRYTTAPIRHVQDKLDGSLIIVYLYDGEIRCATKGSFNSEQAQWAQEFIKRYDTINIKALLTGGLTLLCEGIYPENRICVDYGDREELRILATRSNLTGKLNGDEEHLRLFSRMTKIPMVEFKNELKTHDDIIAYLENLSGINNEGVVIYFEDGSMYKVKNPDYVRLHRMISNISFKNIKEAILDGSAEKMKAEIPDEFLDEFTAIYDDIIRRRDDFLEDVYAAWTDCPNFGYGYENPRKEIAMWIKNTYPQYAPYMFKILDGKNNDELSTMILKKEIYDESTDESDPV